MTSSNPSRRSRSRSASSNSARSLSGSRSASRRDSRRSRSSDSGQRSDADSERDKDGVNAPARARRDSSNSLSDRDARRSLSSPEPSRRSSLRVDSASDRSDGTPARTDSASSINLLKFWQDKTKSRRSGNRGKNRPILLEIDRSLRDYQTLGKSELDNTKPSLRKRLEKLQEVNKQLEKLLEDPGSRQNAAMNLRSVIATEIASLRSQIEIAPDTIRDLNINRSLDWSKEKAAEVMTGGVRDTLVEQNEANALVWFQTLFGKSGLKEGDQNYDAEQERIHQDQQEFLKRYFFALAVLGPLGGDQKKVSYKPFETFLTANGEQVGLASIASGGGLFNFRSDDGSGGALRDFIFGVGEGQFDSTKQALETVPRTNPLNKDKTFDSHLGAFQRFATHGNAFTSDGRTEEKSITTGEDGWIGINIPIGGIGQKLKTGNGTEVTTGYQGRSEDSSGNKYQTGSTLLKHYEGPGGKSNTLIGFEASAPHTKNIHGGSHGFTATVTKKAKKKLGRAIRDKTLTGQGKRSNWGVENDGLTVDENGGRIAEVNKDKQQALVEQWQAFQALSPEDQEAFFKKLLLTTTQQQRDDLFVSYGLRQPEASKKSGPSLPDATNGRRRRNAELSRSDSVGANSSASVARLDRSSQSDGPSVDDLGDAIPPPPPVWDAETGTILDDASLVVREAYREDIERGAFLTEAEGNIVANELGIQANVYTSLPDGFQEVHNPGDGDCLLYALLQARDLKENPRKAVGLLESPEALDRLKREIESKKYRETIARNITDDEIDLLATAAIQAAINGNPEPGLGRGMLELIRFSQRDHQNHQAAQASKPPSPTPPPASNSPQPKQQGSRARSAPASGSSITTLGEGNGNTPLPENIGLLHRGNHYVMIYRPN